MKLRVNWKYASRELRAPAMLRTVPPRGESVACMRTAISDRSGHHHERLVAARDLLLVPQLNWVEQHYL